MIRSIHESGYSFTYMDSLFYVIDGRLFWRVNKGPRARVGYEAGGLNDKGYRKVIVDGRCFKVHRIIYLLQAGVWPAGQIDHINGDKTDNRLANFLVCTNRENHQNLTLHRGGRLPGVHFIKHKKKWRAMVWEGGKVRHLGYYDREFEGFRAYVRYLLDHDLPVRQEWLNAASM